MSPSGAGSGGGTSAESGDEVVGAGLRTRGADVVGAGPIVRVAEVRTATGAVDEVGHLIRPDRTVPGSGRSVGAPAVGAPGGGLGGGGLGVGTTTGGPASCGPAADAPGLDAAPPAKVTIPMSPPSSA